MLLLVEQILFFLAFISWAVVPRCRGERLSLAGGAGRRLCLKTASWGVGDISQLLWNGGYVEKQPCFPVFPQLFQMSSLKSWFLPENVYS